MSEKPQKTWKINKELDEFYLELFIGVEMVARFPLTYDEFDHLDDVISWYDDINEIEESMYD